MINFSYRKFHLAHFDQLFLPDDTFFWCQNILTHFSYRILISFNSKIFWTIFPTENFIWQLLITFSYRLVRPFNVQNILINISYRILISFNVQTFWSTFPTGFFIWQLLIDISYRILISFEFKTFWSTFPTENFILYFLSHHFFLLSFFSYPLLSSHLFPKFYLSIMIITYP